MRATDGILRSLMLRASGNDWPARAIVAASIFFAAALGLFMFIRRATGALAAPLAAPQLVATAFVMCLWALAVCGFTPKRISYWTSLCTLLLVAFGCSFPAARLIDWVVWLPAIGCVALLYFSPHRPSPASPATRSSMAVSQPNTEQILQQTTRYRTADGKDAIRGSLIADFETGARQTTLYVGFCPPFELLPQFETKANCDFEAEVKLVQLLHNGAQLDVRLSEPAEEPLKVSIEFFANEAV